jgi:pre-mRNA-processing factor 19
MGLQSEWNAVQTDLHQLRVKLATAQRELAEALYENDAAKRVIARLLRERDSGTTVATVDVPAPAPTDQFADFLTNEAKAILMLRRRESEAQRTLSRQIVDTFRSLSLSRLTSVLDGQTHFTAIDRNCGNDVVVGAADGCLLRVNRQQRNHQFLNQLPGPIVSIESTADYNKILVGCSNGHVRVIVGESTDTEFDFHEELVGAFWHPKERHIVAVFRTHWAILAVPGFEVMASERFPEPVGVAAYHPDGVILMVAVAEQNRVEFWNLAERRRKDVLEIPGDTVTSMDFSAGSFYFAIGSNLCVRVMHLKQNEMVREYRGAFRGLCFDSTGFLLVVVGQDKWSLLPFAEQDQEQGLTKNIPGGVAGRFGSSGSFFAGIGDSDNLDFIM